MLSSMSSTEFLHWAQHFTQHGFTRSINQFYMGQICASIWNVNLPKDKNLTPSDFYPSLENKPKPSQSSDQIQALMFDDNLGLSFPAPKDNA